MGVSILRLTLFFMDAISQKSGGVKLIKVELRNNESQPQLLRRFRKKVTRSGVLGTVRRKRWFVSKSEVRRIKRKKAIRRERRRHQNKRK